jgi:tetratricopeptide (TPR) repeat protein
LHWTLSRSLYSDRGLVHQIVRAAAERPALAKRLPAKVRGYVFDKGPAVLLPEGGYREIHALVREADTLRERQSRLRRGSDRYYDAHALRYLNRPGDARRLLDEAANLLRGDRGRETTSDAERYAGVVLEQGEISLYQGRIQDAFTAANDLVNGPGRYAIGRWSGWGHWLWAMAHLYSVALIDGEVGALRSAERHLAQADEDFADAALTRGAGDVAVARSLLARLRLALEDIGTLDTFDSFIDVPLTERQRQDTLLLRADFALAVEEFQVAAECLEQIEQSPSSEVTLAWSTLGRAELARVGHGSGPDLTAVRADALYRGAWWLAAQAELGMAKVDEARTQTPDGTIVRALGRPRVLWMTT